MAFESSHRGVFHAVIVTDYRFINSGLACKVNSRS